MALAQPSGLHADRLVGLMNRHPRGNAVLQVVLLRYARAVKLLLTGS